MIMHQQQPAPVNSGQSPAVARDPAADQQLQNGQNQCKGGGKTPEGHELNVKFQLIQRQLVLVLHAQRCALPVGACLLPNCDVMKGVLQHLATCNNTKTATTPTKCPFQFCFSTRQIVTHWRNCGGKCEICVSVQGIISSSKRSGSPPVSRAAKKNRPAPISSAIPLGARFGRFDVKLWDLVLEWGRPATTIGTGVASTNNGGADEPKNYTKISLPCQVFRHAAGGPLNFTPVRLHMKLIPSSILHKLGVMQNVRPLRFQFTGGTPGLAELTEAMKTGHYCGYVHIECANEGAPANANGANGGFKLLILHYNTPSGEFMGYKPTNQQEFIDKLKAIVETERDRVAKPPQASQEQQNEYLNNLNNERDEAEVKKIWDKSKTPGAGTN